MRVKWRKLENYPGFEISTSGQVRNADGKIIKQFEGRKGYLRVHMSGGLNGAPKMPSVHSLVLTTFSGPRPTSFVGAHLDGNVKNNHLLNLKWCSVQENALHAWLFGKFVGVQAPASRLTDEIVRELRRRRKDFLTITDLAKHYGYSRTMVSKVLLGKTWAHVDEEAS